MSKNPLYKTNLALCTLYKRTPLHKGFKKEAKLQKAIATLQIPNSLPMPPFPHRHPFHFFIPILLLFLASTTPLRAGLVIEGARFAPVKTKETHRIACFVVIPSANFSVRIDASAESKLKRYFKSASDAIEVEGAGYENGAWNLSNPQLNCGYILEKPSGLPEYYWLADYNSAPLPLGGLTATYALEAPCERIALAAEGGFPTWDCYSPEGKGLTLERGFRITYDNLVYRADLQAFEKQKKDETLEARSGTIEILAPLADTAFKLLGDQYSEVLGIEFTPIESNLLPAKRLEVYTHYKLLNASTTTTDSTDNEKPPEGGLPRELSAPAKVKMTAVANEPAAARYSWKILSGRQINPSAPLVMQYTGQETEFTFTTAGSFVIAVEVASREGSCTTQSEPQVVEIRTSRLEVPNAFSPIASPGINDIFRVAHSSIISFEGIIFNEWGNRLFHWSDPSGGWDGTFNGKQVPAGVYYYVIRAEGADGKKYDLKGHINILDSDNTAVGDGPDGGTSFSPPLLITGCN